MKGFSERVCHWWMKILEPPLHASICYYVEFDSSVHCLIWSARCFECWCFRPLLPTSWLQHCIHMWDWWIRDGHWDKGIGRELHASTDMWQVITEWTFSLLSFAAVNLLYTSNEFRLCAKGLGGFNTVIITSIWLGYWKWQANNIVA